MKLTLCYNIHDLLKFQINADKRFGFGDWLNLKFSSFQVDSVSQPAIVMNIGRFAPSNDNCYVVDHKYLVKDNYFYCRDSGGRTGWEVEVNGLERGDTAVNFNSASRFQLQPARSLYASLFLPQVFLLRVIEHKLNKMGGFVAHAAAIAKDGQAFLLTGRNGCFKTSLCLEFVRRAGFTWLGDDRIILHEGKALGFPVNPSLFEFMKRHLPDETHWRFPRQLQFAAEYLLGRLKQAARTKPGAHKLKTILLIERNNSISRGKVSFSRLPVTQTGQFVDSLVINSELEDFTSLSGFGVNSAPFLQYLLAYSFVFPKSSMAHLEKRAAENLRSGLEHVPIYRVMIPPEYSLDTFNRVHQFVNGLGAKDAKTVANLS